MTNDITRFPSGESKAFLNGPVGKLEALTTQGEKPITAIICHPHPLFDGTMHNKVVYTLARAFKDMEISTVRFNYRGVEKSEGSYGEGVGETDDLLAVIEWVKKVKPADNIWLAGFSFGTYVVTRAAQTFLPQQLVTIAPAVSLFDFTALKRPNCPWLIVQGEQDEVISPQAVFAWAETLTPPAKLIRMPNTGHFFHGQLVELRKILVNELS